MFLNMVKGLRWSRPLGKSGVLKSVDADAGHQPCEVADMQWKF